MNRDKIWVCDVDREWVMVGYVMSIGRGLYTNKIMLMYSMCQKKWTKLR